MNDDLISRKNLMEQIQRAHMIYENGTEGLGYTTFVFGSCVRNATAVAAVPVSELIEFRDFVYAADGITMRHLKMLNKLIAKYDVISEDNARGQRTLCELFDDACE